MKGGGGGLDCIAPGTVSPEDLLAAADGDGDARTLGHLEACPACSAEVSAYRRANARLGAVLHRVDCPDPLALGELALGSLPPQEALTVRAHLSLCPHCASELESLAASLREDPLAALSPAPGTLARLVARLLPASGAGLAPAGVRGAGTEGSQTYEADGLTISFAMVPGGGAAAPGWSLFCLVLDEAPDTPPDGSELVLLRAGAVVAAVPVDDGGNAVFDALPAGVYALELRQPGRVIAIADLLVGPAPA